MATQTLNFDDAPSLDIKMHKNAKASIYFALEQGETFNENGKIIAINCGKIIKTYEVGEGIEIDAQKENIIWHIEAADLNNADCTYEFSFIQVDNNTRDIRGTIKISQSML